MFCTASCIIAAQPFWTADDRGHRLGDQTEAALKVAAMKDGIFEEAVKRILPRVHELPFDARRKRMTTIHRELNREIAFIKGAPREVLQLCTTALINDEIVPLTNQLRTEILYHRN